MPDYAVLKAELLTDPLALGYAAMTDQQCADALNAMTRVRVEPLVPLAALAIWAAKSGVRAKIDRAAGDGTSPVQSVCLALLDMLAGLSGPPLDLGNPDNLAMVNGLVAAGVMTAGDKAGLLALQDVPPAGRSSWPAGGFPSRPPTWPAPGASDGCHPRIADHPGQYVGRRRRQPERHRG
jgi:hypothetical protein